MISFLRRYVEKLALVAALALLGISAGWTWVRRPRPVLLLRPAEPAATGVARAPSVPPENPEASSSGWADPVAQAGGPDWVYEVFTPPDIYYDTGAKSFRVTPRGKSTEPTATPKQVEFAAELLGVKFAPYRLQLLGYAGAPGHYQGFFTRPNLPGTLLARPGRLFAELRLRLTNLAVIEVPVGTDDYLPAGEMIAVAVLRDERTGAEVTLDSRTRAFSHERLAVLRVGGRRVELHEGEMFGTDANKYRVDRIQLDPPEAEVAQLDSGQRPVETRVLQPPAGDDDFTLPDLSPPRKLAFPAQADLVSVDPGQ